MSRLQAALNAARDTKRLELGPGAIARAGQVYRQKFGMSEAVVIGDANTFRVAGDAVVEQLKCEKFVFEDPKLYAEHTFVEQLQRALAKHDGAVPIAVGSGTINDLTKLAAHRLGQPYMCVATAASMDGYTAYGASITYRGSKQTFDCPAPLVVLADVDVIANAPAAMTASGYADLLAKVTAGADWIVADALGVEPMDQLAWDTVQGELRGALADPAGCAKGDAAAITRLTEGLMMGGFAMQAAQSSRPASGAEHQFSHLWDMQHHTHNGAAPSHGFKVGVATIAVAKFYEELLKLPLETLDVEAACAAWPTRERLEQSVDQLFPEGDVWEVAKREALAKFVDSDALRLQLTRLREVWPELSRRLRKHLPAAGALEHMLKAAGAPTSPEEIGISKKRLRMSFYLALHIRRRFTVLDLAARANVLDSVLNRMFQGDGCMTITVNDESRTITDPAEVAERYRHYRPRILTWSIIGYAMFYFVRKNLPIAMPVMEKQLGIDKSSLGLFLTMSGLLYGVSKFANGVIGDRINAPYFMAFGLVCSAAMNLCFGLSSAVITLGIFWMINGWFQGMGFPPCARLLTHWFEPRELATKMSIWNMSHGIGAGAVVILCGFLVDHFNNWRICFYVPAAMAVVTAGLVLIFLRDTPATVGLPDLVSTGRKKAEGEGFSVVLMEKVFRNKYIWIFSLANFFVYTIRYAVLDWAPTMLKEAKGVSLLHAGMMVAAFEVAGVMGAFCSGWLTDRFFDGRCARLSVVGMILCAVSVAVFWRIPNGHMFVGTFVLMSAGFFIYGPQSLVGIAVANLATKDAAATAVGLTGLFGYASGVLSGWGIGKIVENYGWDRAFVVLLVAAGLGTACFLLAWNAPRDGYIDGPNTAKAFT